MFWHLLRCVDIDFGLRCISARIIIEALAESWLHSEWSWCTWDNRKPEHWDIITIQSLVLTILERLSQARHTKVDCFIMASASLFHLGRNGAQFCKSKHITCHDFGLESNPAVEQQHILFEKKRTSKTLFRDSAEWSSLSPLATWSDNLLYSPSKAMRSALSCWQALGSLRWKDRKAWHETIPL